MADSKISALSSASAADGTEVVPGVQSAANVKILLSQIKTYVLSGLTIAASAISDATSAGRGLLTAADVAAQSALLAGTSSDTLAAGDDSRITGAAQKSSNLSDLASASTARTNLGLGSLATLSAVTAALISDATAVGRAVLTAASAALQRVAINQGATALTDGTNIATNAALNNVFTVTLGGNRTLDNPTNLVAGATYLWIITQDGTGSRTLAYGNLFTWPGGSAPTLTTTAAAVDTISAVYDGSKLRAVCNKGFA